MTKIYDIKNVWENSNGNVIQNTQQIGGQIYTATILT